MRLPFVPYVEYDSSSEVDFTWPLEPWTPENDRVGGRSIAASGARASYVIRVDQRVEVTLRVEEVEYAQVVDWLEWARDTQGTFTFQFDRDIEATAYDVYLDEPSGPIRPERDPEYPHLYRITVTMTTADGEPFDLTWTDEEAGS
jgi:hypothetical protein